MLTLTTQDIKMGQTLATKEAAIMALAQWLEQEGHVGAGYAAGMLAREAQTATYLGQGIAIPHGTQDSRHLVKKTGIKALHLPEGIDWGDGEKAYLVLGIAAGSDEHLELLRQLTRALQRDDLAGQVRSATHSEDILALLQPSAADNTPMLSWQSDMLQLQQPADTMDELLAQAASALELQHERHALQQSLLHLGQGWWLCQVPAAGPAKAAILTTPALIHQGHKVCGLLALKTHGGSHKQLLAQLADWLVAGQAASLASLNSAHELAQALNNGPVAEGEHRLVVTIHNEQGLHARPGALLVQAAKQFEATIQVRNLDGDNQPVNAKSLMKLISLGVRPGHRLQFVASGPDAEAALSELETAVNSGLGEGVTSPHSAQQVPCTGAPADPGAPWQGVAASPGIAIGPLYVEMPVNFDYADVACDAATEQQRLTQALQQADQSLALAAQQSGAQARDILSMHRELLSDPGLQEGTRQRIETGASAPAAWWAEIDSAAAVQAASSNPMLAERAADIRDIGRRVMAILCNTALPEPPSTPYIWVAEDIGPSDVVNMNTERVLGLVTAGGGASSHSAILARSLGIPALVAMGKGVMTLDSGTPAILNGDSGTLLVDPDKHLLAEAEQAQQRERELAERAWQQREQPAVTTDGHRIEIAANLGNTADTAAAVAAGAEGVGLLRTEFVFMEQGREPSLQQQVAQYQQAFSALAGRPLVARTLDVGGDKPLPYWPLPKEDNPFLGVRGIRLCMQRPELLETQLRALLTAAGSEPLRIMFPMVADIAEWRFGKALFDNLQAEIGAPNVQLGMMVEVPSAALNAARFAKEADFFSIGTNDLTQYTLAADRGNGALASLSDGLHPAVLRLMAMTVEAAHAEGKWVGMCGELGADPQALPILLGLGLDEISVSPKRLPRVKARVREFSLSQCKQLAARALTADSAGAVRALTGATP